MVFGEGMDIETLSVIFFFGIIGILIYLDKKNIEFKQGLIIRRTKKGIEIISNIAKKHKRILSVLGNIAIGVGIIAAVIGLSFLIYDTFLGRRSAGIILPTVGSYQYPEPVFSVPFWYWIAAIFIVVTAHEPMHALFARLENVKIKNMGIFLFFVLPLGAFADPDQKQLEKLSPLKKMRIYAAGSFGNLIIAGIFIVLIMSYNFLIDSIISTEGVIFKSTIPSTGASEVGLSGTITGINGKGVKSMNDFIIIMTDVKPGDMIEVKTTQDTYKIKTTQNPQDATKAFVGINEPKTLYIYKNALIGLGIVSDNMLRIVNWIFGFLGWIFLINMGVGTFNLFPLKPLDGGLIFEEILKHFYNGKYVKYLVNGVSLLVLALLLFNLFGPNLLSLIKQII